MSTFFIHKCCFTHLLLIAFDEKVWCTCQFAAYMILPEVQRSDDIVDSFKNCAQGILGLYGYSLVRSSLKKYRWLATILLPIAREITHYHFKRIGSDLHISSTWDKISINTLEEVGGLLVSGPKPVGEDPWSFKNCFCSKP